MISLTHCTIMGRFKKRLTHFQVFLDYGKNSILDHSHDYNRKNYKSSYTLDFKRGILKVQEKSYKTKKKPRRLCFKLLIHSCFNLAMYSFVPIHHMQNVNIVKLTIKKSICPLLKTKSNLLLDPTLQYC